PDQLAIAWPGLARPPGAAGVLDQADRRTRRRADLRLSRARDGPRPRLAWRDAGHGGGLRDRRGDAAAVAGALRRRPRAVAALSAVRFPSHDRVRCDRTRAARAVLRL